MYQFSKDHVIILPHAENYRDVYNISLDEVVLTLNEPELHEGLSDNVNRILNQGVRKIGSYV